VAGDLHRAFADQVGHVEDQAFFFAFFGFLLRKAAS